MASYCRIYFLGSHSKKWAKLLWRMLSRIGPSRLKKQTKACVHLCMCALKDRALVPWTAVISEVPTENTHAHSHTHTPPHSPAGWSPADHSFVTKRCWRQNTPHHPAEMPPPSPSFPCLRLPQDTSSLTRDIFISLKEVMEVWYFIRKKKKFLFKRDGLGWAMGGEFRREGHTYTWLVHGDVWQRPAQCYKKIIKKKRKKERNLISDLK